MTAKWLNRLGLPGVVGALILGLAAWVHWVWLPGQQSQVDMLSSRNRQLHHDMLADAASKASPVKALTLDTAWPTLWQTLPSADQRTALQSEVLSSAKALNLTLATVQFKGERAGLPGIWRQHMVIPVEGRYADVRVWLGQLLTQSSLSLDSLDIQRSDPLSGVVKARVNISLWWRTKAGAN